MKTINLKAPDGWVDRRLAVGSALFAIYSIHYIFLVLGHLKKVNFEALEFL
jgi:hypothetical protein